MRIRVTIRTPRRKLPVPRPSIIRHTRRPCAFVRQSRVRFAQSKRGSSGLARALSSRSRIFIAALSPVIGYIWATTVRRLVQGLLRPFPRFFANVVLRNAASDASRNLLRGRALHSATITRSYGVLVVARHSRSNALGVHEILCPSNRARFPLKAREADMRAPRHGTTLSSLRSLFGSPYNRLLVLPSRRDSPPCIPTNPLRPSSAAPQNNPPCQRRFRATRRWQNSISSLRARARARARVSA